ncbi:MAG: SIMPL domain-containing protein [Clostridia bacterium]|nr:SIMPL domain-containing protein [Clostridia bacterium]
MERIITVRGVGTAKTRPDQVVLSMHIHAKDKDYAKAMERGSEMIEAITAELEKRGFKRKDLKTLDFSVNTVYDSEPDERGIYRSVFGGYQVDRQLKLTFPLDNEKITAAFEAVASSETNPDLNVAFTVKNPSALKQELLEKAAKNASEKAETLTGASGVRLGRLINIDYNWGEVNVFSPTRYGRNNMVMNAKMECAGGCDESFEPDDISSSDSAAFTWAIEG